MTREIPLSRGLVALISDRQYERIALHKWSALKAKNKWYAIRTTHNPKKCIYLHREIMDAPDEMEVDHINGDGLDNRDENLRLCTRSENMRNRGRERDNLSGYKGVCWDKRDRKWRAKIQLHKKTVNLGYFDDPIEAAKVYDTAARELHGEFAKTNF